MSNPRDVNARVSMDPSQYVAGAEKVSWATKQMLRQQETADRKWRSMQGAHQSALNEEAARQAKAAQAVALAEARKQQAMKATGRVMLTGGAAVMAGLGLATKAAMNWESAWTGVTKTVNATPAEFAKIEKGLRSLTTELPASHQQIAAVAEAAGQLGISTGGIVEFTRTMINLGETTNLSAGEAATTLARFANIMGTSESQIDNIGAALVGLGNNFATTEAEIAAMGMRLAGAGVQAGMTEGDILGLAAAASSVGIEAEAGGTALSTTMTNIGKSVDSGGEKLALFAQVAGMTADEFTTAWRDDAGSAFSAVITGLSDTSAMGMTTNQVLDELGIKGMREADAMRRMSSAHEMVTSALESGNGEWEKNSALVAEAAKRYETAESKMQMAKNAITDAAIGIGQTFLPMVADGATAVADLVEKFSSMPAGVQKAIGVLGALAGAAAVMGGGFLLLAPRILAAKTVLADLTSTSPRAAAAVGKVSAAGRKAAPVLGAVGKAGAAAAGGLMAASLAASAFDDGIQAGSASEWTAKLLDTSDAADMASTKLKGINGETYDLADGFRRITDANPVEGFYDFIEGAVGATSSAQSVRAEFDNVGRSLATLFESDPDLAAAKFDAVLKQTGASTDELLAVMPAYRDAMLDSKNAQALGTDTATGLANATDGLTGATEDGADAQAAAAEEDEARTEAIEALLSSMKAQKSAQEAVSNELLATRDAQRGLEQSVDDANKALKENGKTLDLSTEKGRANQDALDGIAEAGQSYVESLREQGASQGKIDKALDRTREQFLKVADSMGLSKKEAEKLARELGLLPDAKVKVDADTEPARMKGETVREFLDRLQATIAVESDGTLAREEGESTGDYIDRLIATIEVDGDTAPARKKGESAEEYISRLQSTIGVGADTVPAREEGESARDYIKRLKGAILKVDADTSDARDKVEKLRKQVINLPDGKITIEAKTQVTGGLGSRSGGLPWGDGEGAGWTGSTPRGVSQMTKAVQSIDPGASITSGYRPGAVTATGYPSYHGMGRAIDIVSPNMGRTWDMLRSAFGASAKELFYTPRGFMRNGVMGTAAPVTRATHYSHVHLALAKGGGVHGPGTGTSDDVPIWASNGEHMWTEREVQAAGGHDAVERLRAAALAGEFQGYKTGGAIGSASRSAAALQAQIEARKKLVAQARDNAAELKRYIRVDEKWISKAERKNKDGEVKRAEAAKRGHERQLRAAEKLLDTREANLEKSRAKLAEQRERSSNLGEARRDLSTSLRRGDLMESATSGVSGAYGVVDQMLGLARSGDLTKGQSNRLAKQAGNAERAMRGLYKQAEGLDKRLEKAKSKLEDIASIKAAVGSALAGEQNLANSITAAKDGEYRDVTRTNSRGETWTEQMWDPGTKASVTAKGMVGDAKSKASSLRAFASKLGQLRKLGMSPTVLQEIAEAGSQEGVLIADAFLKDKGQIDDISRAYKSIATYSKSAGGQVAEAFGLSAAQSLVKSLGTQDAKIEKKIRNWGVYMADGLTGALSGKKSGLKKRAMGGPMTAGEPYLTGELGPELIIPERNSFVLTADQTRRLAVPSRTVTTTAPASAPQLTVQVDNITTVDAGQAMQKLEARMRDSVVMHNLSAATIA